MMREISQRVLMNGGQPAPLWSLPVIAVGLYLTTQGYLTCGKGQDPAWASRAAVLKAEKPQEQVALNRWGGSAEAALLRQSVSRHAGAPASLSNVFVVRDKPMNYLATLRKNATNPLPRPHVSGYPLIFCGHATVKGKLQRFSYMPEIQELILLDIVARSEADLAKDDWREVRRSRTLEREYRRMCGRSLEGGGLLISSL